MCGMVHGTAMSAKICEVCHTMNKLLNFRIFTRGTVFLTRGKRAMANESGLFNLAVETGLQRKLFKRKDFINGFTKSDKISFMNL